MSGYEKHVLQSVLAGFITGLLVSVLTLALVPVDMLEELAEEVVKKQIPPEVPADEVEKALENLRKTIRTLYWITPLSSLFQYSLLGALFGLVKGAFREKFKLGELWSALLTGSLYSTLMGFLSLLALHLLVDLSEYPVLALIVAVSATTYTTLLILFSTRRGPWSRIAEAKPKLT